MNHNKQPMDCDAQLAYSRQLLVFFREILPRKVSETGLIFGKRSEFIRSMRATLQVSVAICFTLVNIQTHTHTHP